MHISEGVLTAPLLVAGGALAAAGVYAGMRKLTRESMTRTALMSSIFFIASFIQIPLGAASIHLVLNGLTGALLRLAAFPAILVALVLQWTMFGFGGFTTLGVNTLNLAVGALVAGCVFRIGLKKTGTLRSLLFFFTGCSGILVSAVMLAGTLALAGESLLTASRLVFAAYLPVAVLEGILSLFILNFLLKVSPEMIGIEGVHV